MADYEVVISGMSGSFPECSNVKELEEKIFTNENLVTEVTDPKWTEYELNVPLHTGKMKDLFTFDQTFFGIHRKLAMVMDVHARHSLEKSFEAICDAGLNPEEIAGTNAAVIMSTMTSETEFGSVAMSKNSGYAMVGHSRCMQGNRLSYFFNLSGPSVVMNSSWTGAMQGLQMAANLVAKGQVKLAIVGSTNVMYKPELSVHYDKLGLLNADGKTKSFSADADGYSRSTGVVVFVVQRAQDALRSYGSIVKVLTATEMNHPSPYIEVAGFHSFINDFYSNLHIKNSDIAYLEGDGSASLKLDAMELNGYAKTLCPGRKVPLPIGCVKSRLGHAEACAAFMSIVNALIAFKTGYIPPCLNFSSPNPLVPALFDGRMKIVTEKTPLDGDLIGVTSFGIGSIFAHVLLKRNPRSCPVRKTSNYPPEGVPRLFLLSGRDEDVMKEKLEKISEKPVDEHFYALNYNLFKTNFPKHLYRGYSIKGEGIKSVSVTPYSAGVHPPIWYIFSGMGSQWNSMGTGLMEIPIIRRAIEKCHSVLLPKGLNLIEIITSTDPANFDNILHAFVGIAAIQIGLVDLLDELGVKPDGIVGHSVGELGCSYADKCLTAEQIILGAYYRGKASNEAKLIKGMMAAVGKGYAQIKDELPEGIEVACHNSKTSCTLSGPADIMEKYVEELKSKGVFARLVNVSNIAYHSKHIAPAAPSLHKYFKEIVPEPKLRSSKWISSSVPEGQWDTDLAKYCSAEYHTNNLLSYVLFEEATAHIPNGAICIEIAPHGLLQAIVKKSLPTCSHVPLTNKAKEGCSFLVEALGKLFKSGVEMDLTKLYPPVKYPLPRETDYSTYITWNHTERWVPLALVFEEYKRIKPMFWKKFTLEADEDIDIKSNHILRRNSYFLKSKIMKYFMDALREHIEAESMTVKCFAFQDITFHQDLRFNNQDATPTLKTLFQIGSGAFEALYKHEKIISGVLTHELTLPKPSLDSDFPASQEKRINMTENQIYEFFEANDCRFNGPLRNISGITIFEKGFAGSIKWRGSSELYFDAIFKLLELYSTFQKDELMELNQIMQFLYNPSVMPENDEDIDVYYDENLGYLCAKGVRLLLFKIKPSQHEIEGGICMKNLQFTPYSKLDAKMNFVEICLQLFRENTSAHTLVLDLIMDKSPLCNNIVDSIKIKTLNDKYEIKLRPRKEIFNISMEKGSTNCYLVVAENGVIEQLNKLIKNNIQFYFIYTGSQVALEKNSLKEHLTPVLEQELNGQRVVLYKQRKATNEDSVFIQMPGDNFVKEAETVQEVRANKKYFLIFKYRILSDLINMPQSSFYCPENNKRFVFIDESSPPFDPNEPFFKEQLAKDLKINIAFRRTWGSVRDQEIDERSLNVSDYIGLDATLNKIRCQTVNLKLIGINLQSIMFPNKYKKVSVIEYSGTIGDKEVFGLGKLTKDNYLEVDAQLCWKKPTHWSFEDAATVPFYYTMAYHLLYLKGRCTNRPYETVLIHGGHTPFAQALLTVAVAMNTEIFTTCFNREQKSFIFERFPQIKKENVLIIVGEDHKTFITHIMDSTNGKGAKLVIDALEDNELRNITFHCTGEYGSYYFLTNHDMETNHTFGLNIFLTQVALFGYNPELIFNLPEEEKLRLSSLMDTGMKMHVVKPLDIQCISSNVTTDEAANLVVSECQNAIPKKIIMPIKKQLLEPQPTKEITKKKCYMIIGTYNCLWFDLLTWLVSNGAEVIHVILNEDEISQCSKGRFDNFISKHKYINVVFSGTQSLNSAQTCNNLIKSIQVKNDIDVLFYLKPGFEKQMKNVDFALRMHSKSSCLVSIGLQACRVVEKRLNDRFRGVSFILTKSSLRNWMVVNALDNWSKKCNENDSFVSVAKSKRREIDLVDKNADVLPSSCYELVALQSNTSEKPCFVEITTRCVMSTYAKDVNPVFVFPGLKLAHLEKLSTQLLYPVYMAQYPLVIKSLNDIAIPFSEMLVKMFDFNIFTLIAEGWAGPLVLTIAKILEKQEKLCEIILLDGSPETIIQWNRQLDRSDSILSKYMPSLKMGEQVSLSDIRNWSTKLSQIILKEEASGFTEDEIYKGFTTLVNRLDVVQNYSYRNQTLESVIHLFTAKKIDQDVNDLRKICNSRFYHRIFESSNSTFLENSKLLECINDLPLVEYKMSAKMPKIEDIATSRLIADEGIYSQEDEQGI